MKNTTIRSAWDTVNPTPAQKKRMRAALEARLAASDQPRERQEELPDIRFMDLTLPQSPPEKTEPKEPSRKRKKPEPQYQTARPTKTNWAGTFIAAAAMLVLVTAGGLFLGITRGNQENPPTYSNPLATDSTNRAAEPTEETAPSELPAAYRTVIQTYRSAIEEGWNMEQCSMEQISCLAAFVESPEDLGYALRDLDGDGAEELLITDGSEIYSMHALFQDSTILWLSGMERIHYYLCEDGLISEVGSSSAAETTYTFYSFSNNTLDVIIRLSFDANRDPENPWFREDFQTTITEEEAQNILNSHRQQAISFVPFPGAEKAPTDQGDEALLSRYAGRISEALRDAASGESQSYCLFDLEGDGTQELLLGVGESLHAILKEEAEGEIRILGPFQSGSELCENGIVHTELAELSRIHHYYRSAYDPNTELEHLVYYSSDSQWVSQGERGVEYRLTQEEAQERTDAYQSVSLTWTPLAQYPVDIAPWQGTTLFEQAFVPVALSNGQGAEEFLKTVLESQGISWKNDEGILYADDPESPGAHISAVLGDPVATPIIYSVSTDPIREVEVRFLPQTEYRTRVYSLGDGVRASDVKELRDFLLCQDETLPLRQVVEEWVYSCGVQDTRNLENLKAAGSSLNLSQLLPLDFRIEEIQGLQEAEESFAAYGFAMVVLTGYANGENDSYSYLNLEMVLEDGLWKVNSCTLEK